MEVIIDMSAHAGDSTVGKTALTQSFVSDGTQFAKTYTMVSYTASGNSIDGGASMPNAEHIYIEVYKQHVHVPHSA